MAGGAKGAVAEGPEPTAADLRACDGGVLTVRAASEFSGLGRTKLWELMGDGSLDWFAQGDRGTRYITKKSLVRMMARNRAKTRANRAKQKQPAGN